MRRTIKLKICENEFQFDFLLDDDFKSIKNVLARMNEGACLTWIALIETSYFKRIILLLL